MVDVIEPGMQLNNNDTTSNSYLPKLEDFHDESSLAWIQASPGKSSKQEKSQPKKKHKKSKTTSKSDDFSALLTSVPQIEAHFNMKKLIGSGTFSNVYLATLKHLGDDSPMYALKHIFSTSHPKRIESEVKCLKEIGGAQHVVGIEGCIRLNGEVVIIMPYIKHSKFMDILNLMSIGDVRDYMWQLMLSLHRVHSFNIIHRDVKPNNFLFDLKTKTGGLVDFGLAQEYRAGKGEKGKPKPKEAKKEPLSISQSLKRPSPTTTTTCNHSARHSTGTCSPKAKRKCLAEIKINTNPPARKSCPKSLKDEAKKIQEKKLLIQQQKRKSPRKTRAGNEENAAPGRFSGSLSSSSLNTPKFASFTSPLPQLHRRSSVSPSTLTPIFGGRKTSKVTIADVFPNIRKYGSRAPNAPSSAAHKKSTTSDKMCACYGKLTVCYKCLARPSFVAPRAGTAGFRAPEVLLRYNGQTTAVDIWAAGVIFLSLLTGRCPFFRPANDVESLSQIVSLFGSKRVMDVAKICGKKCTISSAYHGYDLKGVVMSLKKSPTTDGVQMIGSSLKGPNSRRSPRRRPNADNSSGPTSPESPHLQSDDDVTGARAFRAVDIPDSAFDLLARLLDLNPHTRISATQALNHPFFFRPDALF